MGKHLNQAQSLNESTLLANMTTCEPNRQRTRIAHSGRARRLIVPPNLEGIAIRLTKTELRPGTATTT